MAIIDGTPGPDLLIGTPDDDQINGLEDNDEIRGLGGGDVIDGGDGHDLINGGSGTNRLIGGNGSDMVSYSDAGAVRVDLEAGFGSGTNRTDILESIENIHGSSQDDILLGDAADNIFFGSLGNDHLDGRGGLDTSSYSDSVGGIFVDLAAGTASGGEGDDRLLSIENAVGSQLDDELTGDGGPNILSGLGGADLIRGAGGADRLIGGSGADVLSGGRGRDTFELRTGSGHDHITDFEKKDVIAILNVAFVDDMSDLTIVQLDKDTVVSWDGGAASVTLENFKAKLLSPDNFVFGQAEPFAAATAELAVTPFSGASDVFMLALM